MKKKNKLDAQTRNILSKILIPNTEALEKAELINMIKSDKGVYKYLLGKFYNDRIINSLDAQILLNEINTFKLEARIKANVIAMAEKANLIDVEILKKLEPMEAYQYMVGFHHSVDIGNLIIDFSQKKLGKENEKLKLDLEKHRNIKNDYEELISHSELQNNKIKELRKTVNKVRIDAKKPTKAELTKITNDTKKKNGKLNYKKIGERLGIANHTAKNWCAEYKIK